jgi:dipeptidyl aminopeptidase/acylaminoacyl peptidase
MQRARLVVAGAAACLSAVALNGQSRGGALSIHDLLTAVRVTDPQLSPDGRTVAYVRTTTDPESGKKNADIWTVTVSGGVAKALVTGEKSDDTPRWSPDGRQVAFISARDGDPQLYIADASGANARQVSRVSGGVQPPIVWSPDGKLIAFVADVYPDCKDDPCNRQRRAAAEKNPVKARVLTHLLYRHWNEWREDVRHHVFVIDVAGEGAVRDVTPGDFDSPPFQYEDNAIAFAPDGGSVAFVSNRDGADKEAWSTNKDVWMAPVSGGEAKRLTPNPAADYQPSFTRDGRQLVVRAQRRAGFESDRWYLDVYDRSNGKKRTVFETPDLSVKDYLLSKDDREIYFVASSNGADNLYRVPVAGGMPQLIVKGGVVSDPAVGATSLVFSKSTSTAPADVFVASADGTGVRPLTRENDTWLKERSINAPESLTVAGGGGTPVQYFVVKPPGFDSAKKYPVVFLIHGGPQGDWADGWSYRWNPELWAAQGWVIVAPNPRGSFGFGQKFVDEISGDWGGKVMRDLDAVFDAAVRLPYVDATRQGIAGASYGGYAVDWIIGHTNRFKAAVTHDGVFNLESMLLSTEELWFTEWESGGSVTSAAARANAAKWSPHQFAQNIKTPTLVITNEQDFRVPVDQGLQLFTALRRNGVPSKTLVFPDEGHFVLKPLNGQKWFDEMFAWMKAYL